MNQASARKMPALPVDATEWNWQQRHRCFGGDDVGMTEALAFVSEWGNASGDSDLASQSGVLP